MQRHQLRRREFITLVGGAAIIRPIAASAQQKGGMRRLGFLSVGVPNDAFGKNNTDAFLQGLGALGWREGVNLQIDWRWYSADAALAERQAAELVALKPDVLLAGGNPAVEKLRKQTVAIPVVFALVSDPVGMGYVESLAHPGGNMTGFMSYDPLLYTKQLQMLTEITPPAKIVAVLYNPQTAPYASRMLRAMEGAAKSMGVTLRDAPCYDDAGIEAVLAALAQEDSGGLLTIAEIFNQMHGEAITTLALKYKIPTNVFSRQLVESGGLISYAIDFPDLYRRSAAYVDRILKGEKPADLPVQAPTKFKLTINLRTAKALGRTMPLSLLAIADEVIE
jgi:putative tryptophan/tyrosine transport system substrate-binding protein